MSETNNKNSKFKGVLANASKFYILFHHIPNIVLRWFKLDLSTSSEGLCTCVYTYQNKQISHSSISTAALRSLIYYSKSFWNSTRKMRVSSASSSSSGRLIVIALFYIAYITSKSPRSRHEFAYMFSHLWQQRNYRLLLHGQNISRKQR